MIEDSESARTSESKNHIKIKTNHFRFTENGCIWEGMSLMNACWVSEFYQVLKAVQWWCVWRKCLMEKKYVKKETEKIDLLQVKDLIHIIVYHPPVILLRGAPPLNIANGHQVRNKLRVYISLKENKVTCFANSLGSFDLRDLRNYFWKKYYAILWHTQCTHVPRVSARKAYKKLFTRISNNFSP